MNNETLYLSDEEIKKFSDSVDESKPFSMTDEDLEFFINKTILVKKKPCQ